ncbi:PTS transporter subunit EIIC [Collinsella sp. zg1085]|uniref:PTS transporter subunit EIIC n=1 Tax=Collinsella sp. zg1085 TaxID=2844380 RepID=UPI001C0C2E64|nr:PTS transporter subunit EIIC [Collinsella sp. zg1085]QWT17649.1 PTS transporter subunit EIIC [Collinsella sp. zg1085]
MAAKDYQALAQAIIKMSGGVDNIATASHCMTRLRLTLKDPQLLSPAKAETIPGVLKLIEQQGEYQFVIGQDVAQLYEEFERHHEIHTTGSVEDAKTAVEDAKLQTASSEAKGKANANAKNALNSVLSFIGGTFSPVIPVLVAGGLTGAVLTLLTTFAGVSPNDGTYKVFWFLNQATFYFLPIFIGFSAAQRLKSNAYLGAFLGATLLFFSTNAGEDALSFIGIPVQIVAYNSTVFPVILGSVFLSVLYRFLQKHMPLYLRTIFVPLITMLITVPVTLPVLGPIGNIAGNWVAQGFLALYRIAPPAAVALVGLGTPWLVFFGMNNATYPILFALMAEIGSDPLICTGMAPANVAVGGACLAVAFAARTLEDRSVATSAGITALCGITEPGVYGVLFTKQFPLIGAMIGGGIGGLLAGFLGMTQYVVSAPGFISFAAYIAPDGTLSNLVISLSVMLTAVVISFIVTYVLGKRDASKISNNQ